MRFNGDVLSIIHMILLDQVNVSFPSLEGNEKKSMIGASHTLLFVSEGVSVGAGGCGDGLGAVLQRPLEPSCNADRLRCPRVVPFCLLVGWVLKREGILKVSRAWRAAAL